MSLRQKNLLGVILTLLGLLALIFVATAILLNSFSEVEIRETRTDVERARDSLSNSLSELTSKSGDWANWDDAYAFVQNGNPEFVKSNITTNTFLELKIDVMAFVDPAGHVVFSGGFSQEHLKAIPFPASLLERLNARDGLLARADTTASQTGILLLPEGPLLVVARPILTSEGQGPAHGTLVFGRYLDSGEIKQWAATTHLSLTMMRYDDPGLSPDFQSAVRAVSPTTAIWVKPIDDQLIAGYAVINDIFDQPALILRIDDPRTVYEKGQETARYLFLSLLAVGLAFSIIGTLGQEKMVLSPLRRLNSQVAKIGANNKLSARLPVLGKDELASLAQSINGMLQALERSHTDIAVLTDTQNILSDKLATLQTLAEIERIITSKIALSDRLDLLLKQTLLEMHGDIATISLLNPATNKVEAFAQRGSQHPERWRNLKFELGHGAQGWIAQSAQPIAHPDVREDPRWARIDSAESEEIISYLGVPLRVESRVIGVLDVATRTRRNFTPDAVDFMMTLGGRIAGALETSRLFEAEQTRREELSALYELSRSLADTTYDPTAILEIATRHAVNTLHVRFARAVLLEGGEFVVRASYPVRALEHDIEIGHRELTSAFPFCHWVLKQNAPTGVSADSPDLTDYERAMLCRDIAKAIFLVPLRVMDRPLGLLLLGEARNETREPFSADKIRLARSIGDQTASALYSAELHSELEDGYLQTVLALAAAVDAKDSYTGDHSARLAQMALAIGHALNLNPRELEDIRFGATLHDIGKIGVPDAVLLKPAALDQDDWMRMRQHPDVGARILAPIPRLAGAAAIVRHHHERFDGKGYPDGLAGKAIPIGARILTVVDSYSAIVDKRVYKEARTHQEAVAELERCAGTQFDPHIVRVFLQLMDHELSLAPTIAAGEMAQ